MPAYRSEIDMERLPGGVRRATLPGESEPVLFGMHGAVAEHYKRAPGDHEPHATTIDYVIAATGGWLLGTYGGALDARHIPAGRDELKAHVTGDVELDGNVLVIRRIHVRLELRVAPEHRPIAERVHGFFADFCPLYRTLKPAIAITTELALADAPVETAS